MAGSRFETYLDEHRIKYVTIRHSRAFTALEIAESAHVRGKEFAKTVIVKLDDRYAMAVIPSHYNVDLGLLREASGADDVSIAPEEAFKELFPDCEVGAMPPFGNLYGLDVLVEVDLSRGAEIVFNAGSHTELIRLAYADYARLVRPKVIKLAVPA